MIMNGILKGGLIQLAGSAFNSGLSALAAKRQYDRQLDFWQKQNQFNDPLNQRRRMERAGFNPAAFAGEVASNNVAGELSNAPGNEVMKNGAIDLQALNNSLEVFGKLERMGADTELMRRQIELSFIEEIIKNGEAYGIQLDNEQKSIMLKYMATEKEVSLQKALAEIDELTSRSAKNEAEANQTNELLSSVKAKLEADASLAASLATWNTELLEFEKQLKSASTQQAKAAAARDFAQSKLTNITSSLQEKYGDRDYAARVSSAEAAAKYADELQASAVRLQETSAALNENQALTNEAKVEIERAAQDLKERALALDENKFQLETVKAGADAVIKIVDAATPW